MDTQTTLTIRQKPRLHLLATPRERRALCEKARGMWEKRRPDPIRELQKIRREWERKMA